MNRALRRLNFPALPPDKRRYDLDLQSSLRSWTNAVVSNVNPGFGSVVASAPTIALTSNFHHISGTAAIKNIVSPPGVQGLITLVPDGAWTMVTGGNIALSVTAVVNKILHVAFDGSRYFPSYQ